MKLNTLKPRLKELDTANPRGLVMAHDLKRNGYPYKPAMRWTKDENGRVLRPGNACGQVCWLKSRCAGIAVQRV